MKSSWSRYLFVLSILVTGPKVKTLAQSQEILPIRLMIRTSFGTNVALSPLEKKAVTDNLIKYDKNSFYLQFISGTYFFDSHWGGEITISSNVGGNIDHGDRSFDWALDKKYSDQYFIDYETYDYTTFHSTTGTPLFFKVQTGPVYKIESGKIVVITRLLAGISTLGTDYRSIRLKEKGSNEGFDISYNTKNNSGSNTSFIISPGVSFGYRIFRRIMLTADLGYSGYKIDPEYIEKTTRATTGEVTTKTYRYNSFIHELNLGIGASVVLWQK